MMKLTTEITKLTMEIVLSSIIIILIFNTGIELTV